MFACDFEPGDVVANLDWERKLGRSLALPFFKGEGRLAKRQPLEIKGPHDARFHCAGSRSQHLGGEPTRCIVGTRKRSAARHPAPCPPWIGWCPTSRANAPTNSFPPPTSIPSDSQTSSTRGAAPRKRSRAGKI